MLSNCPLAAFVGTTSAQRAKTFYRDTLGLRLVREDPIALAFDSNGTSLRVQLVKTVAPHPYTALGWRVTGIAAVVSDLQRAGVRFEHFEGIDQDVQGIWTSPDGTRVAWFKDPDGNLLSLADFTASQSSKP